MQFCASTTRIHTGKWPTQSMISCKTPFIFVNYTFVDISTFYFQTNLEIRNAKTQSLACVFGHKSVYKTI